jgi:hypothetical protein
LRITGRCALALVCLAAHALAEPPDSAPDEAAPSDNRVQVVLVGEVDVADLRALIREWLEPAGFSVEVEAERTLNKNEVLAVDRTGRRVRVWVTLVPRGARLYFADREAARFLVRDVPLDAGLGEVGREQVAQVLLSAAIAFVEKREETPASAVRSALADADRPEPGQPTAPPRNTRVTAPRPASSTAALRGSVDARYLARYAGPGGFSHGPGIGVSGGLALPRSSLSLEVRGHGEFPHRVHGERVDLDISALCVRGGLEAAYSFARGHETALEVLLGPCWFRAEPVTSDPTIRPREAHDERLSLGIALPHSMSVGSVSLVLGLSLDVDLVEAHYSLRVDGDVEHDLSPWQVRPGAFVGIGWP